MPPSRNNSRRASLRPIVAAAALLCTASLVGQDFSHPDTKPAASAALIQQANDSLASGDLPAALRILTALNIQTPNNAQILYDLGLTLEALGPAAAPNPPAAGQPASDALTPESAYRAAIVADPSFAPAHVALGLLFARANHATTPQLVEARTELIAATTLPDVDPVLQARAYRALARLDLSGSNQNAAASELLAALKLTPEQPDDILLSAEIAAASSDLPAAEQAYRRYLALPGNASDSQATAALAHILIAEDHYADAESLLTTALAHDSGNPALTALLAQSELNSGDPAKIAQATPLVESLHAKNPENASVTRLLARIYLETGHPDQADPLYASLLSAQADHPDPTLLDNRAEVLIRLHRPGEAEKLLKVAVADPAAFPTPAAFADAATRLAFAAEEIDDPAAALQALALRAKVQQPSPSSLFLEATANDDLHHSIQAADLYKQFLAAAHGTLPDQESQARRRLSELEHRK
jgi:Tfp pilus assembly protein PilF